MSMDLTLAAVDLGASSGRVMAARVGPGRLELDEAHRFPNRPVRTSGTLRWDVLGLYAGVLDGLRAAASWNTVLNGRCCSPLIRYSSSGPTAAWTAGTAASCRGSR